MGVLNIFTSETIGFGYFNLKFSDRDFEYYSLADNVIVYYLLVV